MSDKVKERWAILRIALREGRVAQGATSVRNHPGFSLFTKERVVTLAGTLDTANHFWEAWDYLFKPHEVDSKLLIRQKENKISVSELLHSSDNTGNICVWPSEEVLAHYCCQHLDKFSSKSVCELAAGASGLAGLSMSRFGQPKSVVITDGDSQAVDNINVNIQAGHFSCAVTAKQLLWGKTELPKDYVFDYVIAADCLFLENFHTDLLATLDHILMPEGAALFVAPRRGSSMTNFVDKAKLQGYDVAIEEDYDAQVSREHARFQSEPGSGYNTDIHFPVLLTLWKSKKS